MERRGNEKGLAGEGKISLMRSFLKVGAYATDGESGKSKDGRGKDLKGGRESNRWKNYWTRKGVTDGIAIICKLL